MFSPQYLLTVSLLPLMAVPVWAAGGTYKAWQGPFLWVCLIAWLGFFLPPEGLGFSSRKHRVQALLKDPPFWGALGFLLLVIIQTMNSGRMQVFDFETGAWTYSNPPISFLPSAVVPHESFEMIKWFAPAFTLFLILRHAAPLIHLRLLCWLIALNGFLNAMLAFIHQAMGWEYMYNLKQFGKDVYGSFGYPNHGAMYFILLFALALGLLLRELLVERTEMDRANLGFAMVWTPVFFLAANLSTSRAGILGAWIVLGFTLLSIAAIAWPRIHPVQRVTGSVFIVILSAGLIGFFIIFAQPVHMEELRKATVDLNVYNEIGGRFFQIEAAWAIWKDHPWVGVGGWGYRYFVAMYLDENQWGLLGTGKANVHNDFMQFLAEFGLVGMSCLITVFGPTFYKRVKELFRAPSLDDSLWADPLRISCGWGIFTLVLVSIFDIPLRSPAVMLHGIFLLFLLNPGPDMPSVWSPIVDWKRLQAPLTTAKNRIWGVQPEE